MQKGTEDGDAVLRVGEKTVHGGPADLKLVVPKGAVEYLEPTSRAAGGVGPNGVGAYGKVFVNQEVETDFLEGFFLDIGKGLGGEGPDIRKLGGDKGLHGGEVVGPGAGVEVGEHGAADGLVLILDGGEPLRWFGPTAPEGEEALPGYGAYARSWVTCEVFVYG